MSETPENEKVSSVIWIVAAIYCISFLVFYPSVITVADESYYVREAVALSHGSVTVFHVDPLTGKGVWERPSDYPIGTSLLMAALAKVLGWKAAFLIPLISFVVVLWVLAKWLAVAGRNSWCALTFLFFPPALVMGRVAMSDMPSAALVATALWLFWMGGTRPTRWILAGLIAGVSVMFRETNPVVFAPFVAGAVLRGEQNRWYLASAFATGLASRLVVSRFLFGDALFARAGHADFVFSAILRNVFHGFVLIEVLLLGLMLVAFAYRGERRPEVLTSLICFLGIYLLYNYSGEQSGGLKGAILGGRFYLPVVPLSIFAASEVLERLAAQFRKWRNGFWASLGWNSAVLRWLIVVVACGNAVAVHAAMNRWSSTQKVILETIYSDTPKDAVVVSNLVATGKFINELYGPRQVLDTESLGNGGAESLIKRHGEFHLVILDRFDSPFWRDLSKANQGIVGSLAEEFCLVPITDIHPGGGEELRVWSVRSLEGTCSGPAGDPTGKVSDRP